MFLHLYILCYCCKMYILYYCYSFCILWYLCITVYALSVFYVTVPSGIGPIAVGNKYINRLRYHASCMLLLAVKLYTHVRRGPIRDTANFSDILFVIFRDFSLYIRTNAIYNFICRCTKSAVSSSTGLTWLPRNIPKHVIASGSFPGFLWLFLLAIRITQIL
jgi:hypothetical protein